MTQMLTDRYHDRLAGTLSCYDRIDYGDVARRVLRGGDDSFLNARHIQFFDYPRFVEPLRDRIREAAQALATAQRARESSTLPRRTSARKPCCGGLRTVGIIQDCACALRHGSLRRLRTLARQTKSSDLSCHTSGKCLHYYFYWMDETLGLIYLVESIPAAVLL